MKKLTLKSMEIKNFRGTKERTIQFGESTKIKGRNASGKTNTLDAYCWLLTGKLSNGSAEEVRPYGDDESDVSVKAVFDMDGEELVLEKIQVLDIEKKTGRIKGNKNKFFINDIAKKTEKDFKAYLEENVADEEQILYSTIATAFLNLDNKKSRAKLFELVSDFSDEEVFKTNEEFEMIRSLLKAGTPDEVLASLRTKMNGKGRTDKGLKGRMDEIPAITTEIEKQIVDTDFDKQIEEVKAQASKYEEELSSVYEERDKRTEKSNEFMHTKFQINTIESKLVNDARKGQMADMVKKDEIYKSLVSKKSAARDVEYEIRRLETESLRLKASAESKKAEWDRESKEEIIVPEKCPTCGQKIPKAKLDATREKLESENRERRNIIAGQYNSYLKSKKETDATIKAEQKKLSAFEKEIKELKVAYDSLDEKTKLISDIKVDFSTNKEWCEAQTKLAEIKKEIDGFDESGIQDRIRDIQSKIFECESIRQKFFAEKIANDERKNRVAELKEERRNIGQQLAEIEQKIDLVRDFQKTKCEMITDKINSKFGIIKWQLFKQNISNDGFSEVCKATVNGIEYSYLNHASKMLVEMDICKSFQNMADIQMPIWIDDSESLDSTTTESIAKDRQMIFLKVADTDFTIETI